MHCGRSWPQYTTSLPRPGVRFGDADDVVEGVLAGPGGRLFPRLVLHEPDDPVVHDEVAGGHRPAEHHVELAVREDAAGDVDDDAVERLALALVDGHRPGELHRILAELADDG